MTEGTLHKANHFIVKKYSLARRISEVSFYKFKTMLIYKIEQLQIEYGRNVALELVNPRNTSQMCSSCGTKSEVKLRLSYRIFTCTEYGMSKDRDLNAAINILLR